MSNFWPIGAGSLKKCRLAGFLQGFQNFFEIKNDSNFFYELLRSILTYTELPHIFEKKVIKLVSI